MPTKKEFRENWDSQRKIFGGYGMPRNHFESEDGGNGFTDHRYYDTPTHQKRSRKRVRDLKNSSRKIKSLGKIFYNESSKKIEIVEDLNVEEPSSKIPERTR